jgi:hypothetical protein
LVTQPIDRQATNLKKKGFLRSEEVFLSYSWFMIKDYKMHSVLGLFSAQIIAFSFSGDLFLYNAKKY